MFGRLSQEIFPENGRSWKLVVFKITLLSICLKVFRKKEEIKVKDPGHFVYSLVNLWFDVEKIATEAISAGNVSSKQNIKEVGKSKLGKYG